MELPANIAPNSITTRFQPIFSISERKIVGFEESAWGVHPVDGSLISRAELGRAAGENGSRLELDRSCRESAVRSFMDIEGLSPDAILFLNIDAAVLQEQTVGSNHLIRLTMENNLYSTRVVLEIAEDRIADDEALLHFAKSYRDRGFLFALKDLGTGHSDFEIIRRFSPDIIKLGDRFITGLHRDYQKQAYFDFTTRLAHTTGVMVIADHIASKEDALAAVEHGADLVQGDFFIAPQDSAQTKMYSGLPEAIDIGCTIQRQSMQRHSARQKLRQHLTQTARELSAAFRQCPIDAFDERLTKEIRNYPSIECAYILHESGMQISSTVFQPGRVRRSESPLFVPATVDCDLSMKEYFCSVNKSQPCFISEPYISHASGTICMTVSMFMEHLSGRHIVLCIDFDSAEAAESKESGA